MGHTMCNQNWHTNRYERRPRRSLRHRCSLSSRFRVLRRDFDSISAYDLILLSLGIEPQIVAELYQLDAMQEDEVQSLHFGKQHAEFQRRLATLMNHVANSKLSTVPGEQRTGSPHVRVSDFLTWAKAQGWSLPGAWETRPSETSTANTAATVTRSDRDRQKAKTQERYASWQREADRLWEENPRLSKYTVARRIANNAEVSDGKDEHTVRKHIRKRELGTG